MPKDFDDVFPSLSVEHTKPYGWIQWKGTNVCMDVLCECGYHGHLDAMFAYHVRCPQCHTIYECDGYVTLRKVPKHLADQCCIQDVE
jgi:hypothetical protein